MILAEVFLARNDKLKHIGHNFLARNEKPKHIVHQKEFGCALAKSTPNLRTNFA